MTNQQNRTDDDMASSNDPADPTRKPESGSKSGGKSPNAEKPEDREWHGEPTGSDLNGD